MSAALLFVAALAAALCARTVNITTHGGLVQATNGAVAGDTLLVQAGTYNFVDPWHFNGKSGTADSWIVARAVGKVVVRGNSDGSNILQFTNAHYIRVTGFEITASVSSGPTGVKIQGTYCSHLELDSLYIHDIPFGGIEAFPDSAAFLTIRNCEIARTAASGIYLGYPGTKIIHDVIMDNNYIHHCPADSRSDIYYGIQFKGWCYRARIRDNVLHDVSGTTRSAICVYYGKNGPAGDVPADMNVVAGNVIWNSRGEGITAMSDALIENNIVFDAGLGLHLQTYADGTFSNGNFVENLIVRNNTVFRCRDACLYIEGWSPALLGANVSVTRNLFYQTEHDLLKPAVKTNASQPFTAAANYYYGYSEFNAAQGFAGGNGLSDFAAVTASGSVPGLNFYPSGSAPFLNPVDSPSYSAAMDFDGTARPVNGYADAGAYEYSGAMPTGWAITPGFKGNRQPPFVVSAPRIPLASGMAVMNTPNPFSGSTMIAFRLPAGFKGGTYVIYNAAGQKVAGFRLGASSGNVLRWNGCGASGRPLPSGRYVGELTTADGQRISHTLNRVR